MKKNAMLKIAAILLVAVLLTTCAISSTFAKYVTNVEGTAHTARVAKWGVTAQLTAKNSDADLFLESYGTDAAWVEATTNVVAPGTEDSITYVVGITENDVEVSYDSAFVAEVSIDGFSADYMPVVFTVNGTGNITTEEDLIAAIEDADASNGKELTISWNWAYSTSAENDVKDTALGNATDLATISIKVGLTVFQTGTAGTGPKA